MVNDGKTLETHTYRCGWCDAEFQSNSRSQLVASRRHNAVYCSSKCKNQRNGAQPGRHCGICKTCGESFRSRVKDKQYCSLPCYLESDAFTQRLNARNEAAANARAKCKRCGGLTKSKRQFCSKVCYRAFFAERFDRFVASPESLALPQNYDEFLSKEELPCIVDGCEWVGHRLGHHCNVVHGIDVRTLRELAGFNRRTGVVSATESARLSEQAKELFEDGKIGHAFLEMIDEIKCGERDAPKSIPTNSLEAREHRRKSAAMRRFVVVNKQCKECGADYETNSLAHGQLFCSVQCRRVSEKRKAKEGVEPVKCSFCGELFTANKFKADRAKKGLKVTCSDICRNRMNIAGCLAKQGRRAPASK